MTKRPESGFFEMCRDEIIRNGRPAICQFRRTFQVYSVRGIFRVQENILRKRPGVEFCYIDSYFRRRNFGNRGKKEIPESRVKSEIKQDKNGKDKRDKINE
jgi:hypothetical protein